MIFPLVRFCFSFIFMFLSKTQRTEPQGVPSAYKVKKYKRQQTKHCPLPKYPLIFVYESIERNANEFISA
ncbi:hypothetical protein DWV34_01520 [Anaerostipes sp. AF04-45]|nr:hypothetical protein DWV34_01520 [Anaerostipes sp. AF04-45]